MDESERIRILDVLTDHIANDTTADAGGIMRAPITDFTCPDLLEQEYEVFFRNTPLCMGLSSELPKPNTYWSDNASGVPILMVRDVDGKFQAYANACRHRGSLVVPEGRGTKLRFTCPFHAWTYGIDGKLLSVNKSNHFGDVSTLDLGLIKLPCAELHGTLWVRPTPGEPIDENECLAGLQRDLMHWNFPEYAAAGTQIIDARMNWKIGVDSYGEIYHLNVLHTKTLDKEVVGNAQTFHSFEKNLRMVIANEKLNLMRMLMPIREKWPYKQITYTVYFFYPNVIMMVDAFGVDFLRIFPLDHSPSKSRTMHTWYIDPKVQKYFDDHEAAHSDRMKRFRAVVENEDYAIAEDMQVNAERGTPPEIVLGRNEIALQHFHNAHRLGLDRELLPVEDL